MANANLYKCSKKLREHAEQQHRLTAGSEGLQQREERLVLCHFKRQHLGAAHYSIEDL